MPLILAESSPSRVMDMIQDTPTKRRKLGNGYVDEGRGYNSQDDSGDDLFQGHETVATVPLPGRLFTPAESSSPPSSPPPHLTQPTQIVDQKTPISGRKPSIIQVAASSPAQSSKAIPTPTGSSKISHGGSLASIMAPAGTAFRLPMGVKKPQVIDLSDDEGATYRGGPSDEEHTQDRRVDIKPSTFVHSTRDAQPKGSISKFREITAGAFYKPIESSKSPGQGSSLKGSVYDARNRDEKQSTSKIPTTAKRSADVMANAYGGARRPPKPVQQTAPAKAQPPKDISLDDIGDYQLRTKVERARIVLPRHSVLQIKEALLKKKCNYDDALDLLLAEEPQPLEIDLTGPDSEEDSNQLNKQKGGPERPVKTPMKSIQERWTATQFHSKPSQAPLSSSPLPAEPLPLKPRKRLIQGRRRPSPPATKPESPMARAPSPPRRQKSPDSDASDSALGSEAEEDQAEIEAKVLNFFNTCSTADLEDIAAISTDVATLLLSKKPFNSLAEVRKITDDKPTAGSKAKRAVKKPIGDRIVDKCIEMWTGYEAVDELVRQCEALGRPIAEEMKKWGVDVYGSSKDGELDLVILEHPSPGRDSGIGTPTTIGQFSEEDDGDVKRVMNSRKKPGSLSQPGIMGRDVVLKDYQVVGVNWLSLLFEQKLSAILADDMGLGKTCQVIAFLAHLKEKGITGPHLIVVPASTLENWLREFSIFCPELTVMPFYADLKGREGVREQIQREIESINVIVTTYGMAKLKDETKFLRRLSPVVCVYDEGHTLKNSESKAYGQLMRIPAQFRLLLTGTPLQNNLRELVSLLGFILPSVFEEHSEDLSYIFSHKAKTTDDSHAALLSVQRIARAKAMMTPFVLRRKKHQVLKHLPSKTRRIEYCELTTSQREIYEAEKQKALKVIQDRAAGLKTGNDSSNIMMSLRKASIHPLLFRRHYNEGTLAKMSKACLREPEFAESNPNLVYEDMEVMTDHELLTFCSRYPNTMAPFLLPDSVCLDSGKVTALVALLKTYLANNDRVLIFSQFVQVLNLLEPVLDGLGIAYSRLDGGTAIATRQPLIDAFAGSDPPIPVFLLSTKAGGAGINLACANKVVIFDSSFNPQDDIQAENRAHRVGQTRAVEVVRLVSRATVEEQILALGETKVALDERVAGGEGEGENNKAAEKEGMKKVEEMMLEKLKAEQEEEKRVSQ